MAVTGVFGFYEGKGRAQIGHRKRRVRVENIPVQDLRVEQVCGGEVPACSRIHEQVEVGADGQAKALIRVQNIAYSQRKTVQLNTH